MRDPRRYSPAQAVGLAEPVVVQVLPAVSAANTAAATSSGVDLTGYDGVVAVVVNCGAITGTMDPKIQDSADNSSFADVAGLTAAQVATASQVRVIKFQRRDVRRYIKFVGTVGTGPVLIGVTLVANKQVSG